jgi:hypothetical protein
VFDFNEFMEYVLEESDGAIADGRQADAAIMRMAAKRR